MKDIKIHIVSEIQAHAEYMAGSNAWKIRDASVGRLAEKMMKLLGIPIETNQALRAKVEKLEKENKFLQFMVDNGLGEEDLNPHGFQRWRENQRMTSMMSPTIINYLDGSVVALGSGGSNRIRTAILQTVINLIDFKMTIHDAVSNPRVHFENGLLNLERGFESDVLQQLLAQYPDYKCWDTLNLFFGGVHSVQYQQGIFDGVGDPRRGGVCATL